jgi:ABC-type glycerol-3-phosphate transport system substrate-binding protein
MKKIVYMALAAMSIGLIAAGCSQADVASENLSKAADSFEISRRIVFYNGINGEYMLTIEGL